ncbi:MAG TPA: hypothetical protein VII51_12575 [Gaiellaceae bacterium]
MRTGLRAALVAVAAMVAVLVASGSALAAPNTATVVVSHSPMTVGSSQATTIDITVPAATDPIAAINIYVPAGYSLNLSAAPGTTIGSVTAAALAHDAGLTLPLVGNVVTDDPAAHTADACAPGVHAAVWNLNLSVGGTTLVLPFYVDPTSGAEQALGAYKLEICLPPWDTPVGSVGRSFEGAQLLESSFTVKGIFTTPSSGGLQVWKALFTPYTPAAGTPNLAGTFEARALVPLPLSSTVKALKKGARYAVSGRLTEAGLPVSGASVVVYRGITPKKLTKTGSATSTSGSWSVTGKRVPKKTLYFKSTATVAARDDTTLGCQNPLPATVAPAGCVSATLSPWTISSPVAKLKP